MTRYILLFSAILLLAGGASLFAAEDCGCFQVDTRKGPQTLGGKSGHSSHDGLHQAAESSGTVVHVTHEGG